MKNKIIICIIVVVLVIFGIVIWLNFRDNNKTKDEEKTINSINQELQSQNKQNDNDIIQEPIVENIDNNTEKEIVNMIKIRINNNIFDVELEENEATKSLIEKLESDNIIINASDYGGFEKIGNLGFKLPKNDKNVSTSAGDIVLYQGDKISLFYNSNSWSYTKIGKIKNITSNELKNILGDGDVTLVFSID